MEKEVIATETFQLMDRMDDQLIEAELKNRVVDTWGYSFKDSTGRLQEGLSKVGVDEACVEMSRRGYIIREGEVKWGKDPTNPEFVLFHIQASLIRLGENAQEIVLDVVNGTKRQWTKMKMKSGQITEDPFWFEKGAMKAARNARSRLIPSEVKTKILVLARQKGKVRKVNGKENPRKENKYDFLQEIGKLKKQVDEKAYYELLGLHGYSHSNEIIDRDHQVALYKDLKKLVEEGIIKGIGSPSLPNSNS